MIPHQKLPFPLNEQWLSLLEGEWDKPYIQKLFSFLNEEKLAGHTVYPPEDLVFNALNHLLFDKVSVVIMGQDPYHGPKQAHGLSFSVAKGVPPPPSLQNIFKELNTDLGLPIPKHGSLLSWARQGVLLLNATLTVRKKNPRSHYGKGWELFTDAVVSLLAQRRDPVIFVLWGKSAQEKCDHLLTKKDFVLKAPHPSPYSAHSGFFGCRHFSRINHLLMQQSKPPIDWELRGC